MARNKNNNKKKSSSVAATAAQGKKQPQKQQQQKDETKKKVSFDKKEHIKEIEETQGYESYSDNEDIDNEMTDVMQEDNEGDSIELQQLNLTIMAGTYNANLLGWRYLLETRLDFDHILKSFVSNQQQQQEENNGQQDEEEEEEVNNSSDDEESTEEKSNNASNNNNKNDDNEEEEEDAIDQMIDDDLEDAEDDIQVAEDGVTEVLSPLFAVKPHTGSINCVTSNGKYMASGGFDENIVIYNLKTKKDSGVIHHTQGSITCMALFDHFLFVGSTQGMLTVYYQSATWPKVWEIEAHANNAVKSLTVHPTGRLAITLGETDHRLRLWNMMNGTLLQTISLGMKTYIDVQWSPNGDSFAVLQRNSVDVYSADQCELVATVPQQQQQDASKKSTTIFTCFKYLSEQVLAIGTAEGNIQICNLQTNTVRDISNVHKSRIKAMDSEAVNVGEFALVSVCSAGILSVHRVSDEFIFQEAVKQTGVRFTCISLNHDPAVKQFVEERYREFEAFLDDEEEE